MYSQPRTGAHGHCIIGIIYWIMAGHNHCPSATPHVLSSKIQKVQVLHPSILRLGQRLSLCRVCVPMLKE